MHIVDTTEPIEAVHDDLSRSTFHDVNLNYSVFTNSSLIGAAFDAVSFNNARLHNVSCVGMQFTDADLSGVTIVDANTTGMTIDGIPVADLLTCYRQYNPA